MVDKTAVTKLMRKHFSGPYTFEVNDDLSVSARGTLRNTMVIKQLPVTFAEVDGVLLLNDAGLETLQGLPPKISRSLLIKGNQLKSLEHCPTWIGETFNCSLNPLNSLEHGPTHVGETYLATQLPQVTDLAGLAEHIGRMVNVDYDRHLGLLRLLVAKYVFIEFVPDKVNAIMTRYQGQGHKGALACAAELADAGYKGNARW